MKSKTAKRTTRRRASSQVPPPEVVACFSAAGSRVKTRKHFSAFTSQHAPLAEPVVSGNACNQFACAIGQDSHAFERKGLAKPLVLAGVTIPACPGLAGNSDADVVLHAITNAVSGVSGVNILGAVADAMCLGSGITDSREYLDDALRTLVGWRIVHVSVSIEAKRPKLAPHIDSMRASIARLCTLAPDGVGITATTGEELTAFGKGLGIQAFAIVTAERIARASGKSGLKKSERRPFR
jgi:2-C-methyl-D-erythritol 2,4-cyclodiphosphate synthase